MSMGIDNVPRGKAVPGSTLLSPAMYKHTQKNRNTNTAAAMKFTGIFERMKWKVGEIIQLVRFIQTLFWSILL